MNWSGGFDDKELSSKREEEPTKNCRQRQALPLCQVSQEKSETRKNSSTLVLSELLERRRVMRSQLRSTARPLAKE
jgi:hypothetical protein